MYLAYVLGVTNLSRKMLLENKVNCPLVGYQWFAVDALKNVEQILYIQSNLSETGKKCKV